MPSEIPWHASMAAHVPVCKLPLPSAPGMDGTVSEGIISLCMFRVMLHQE